MKSERHNPAFFDTLLQRIRDGVTEGIRREVQRRRKAGLPLHVERDGRLVTLWPSEPRQQQP